MKNPFISINEKAFAFSTNNILYFLHVVEREKLLHIYIRYNKSFNISIYILND